MNCPLSNQPCPNDKTVHVTTIINGALFHLDLCPHCCDPFTFAAQGHPPGLASTVLPVCRGCGSSLDLIVQTGRLGCADCYNNFHDQLLPVFEKHHGGATRHQGKVPRHRLLHNNLHALRDQLARAVAEERYGDAANLRDRIKELKDP